MWKRSLAPHFAGGIKNANLMLLRTPVDASKPAYCFIGHDLCPRRLHEPPRRLPEPVLALKGATSYWASVAANRPGHKSNAGARGTSAQMVAPGRLARADSLYRHRPRLIWIQVHKFGGLGYVGFAEEVRAQEAELGVRFDYVVVCVVTGSTQAGMIVGFAADGRADRVIGIDASGTPAQTRAQVRQIVDNTAELVELGRMVRDDEIVILGDYAYPAYGVPSAETNEAIRFAARTEAMITDPVYEGKSMQGLIDLVHKGYFPEGSKVLYAHLGGAPALNGYSYTYRNG